MDGIEIMNDRESYDSQVRAQFAGRIKGDPRHHLTDGVRHLLTFHDVALG
ncbi:MAG TPA: hypothetical protein VGI60_13145 [Chthoniobacterales bacterium]|jgi:hypothetical protein